MTWRSSSYSGTDGNCVEVALIGTGAVRDSKNPNGPTLAVDLSALLATVKAGKVDR
jgi:hypothetical protein